METSGRTSRPVLTQTENNTTLWVGHLSNEKHDHLAGQTFTCPAEGVLNNIQVYSAAVPGPGRLQLTLHEFDCDSKEWGAPISRSERDFQKSDESKWVKFELEPVLLKQNSCYGFRLQAIDACIGLGEAVSDAKRPFQFGQAWSAKDKGHGKYFNYFSLAFKVELCA